MKNQVVINKFKSTMEYKQEGRSVTVNMDAEYAGQVLTTIPAGYINKKSCGVGFTTVAIENPENVVIAMPSVELIKNKEAQYPNSRFTGKLLGVYSGVTADDVIAYAEECNATKQPIKVAVTYDSLAKVEAIIANYNCRLIIDESDRLLAYTHMKLDDKATFYDDDVVTQVLTIAKKHAQSTSFISATPTPIEYLPEWVSQLPQYTYNWEHTVEVKPLLMQRQFPFKSLKEEILFPMQELGFAKVGAKQFSKAIIFINSVKQIAKMVKECGISRDDVRVVCADGYKNDTKINGFLRLTEPSNLTKYTFITSSGWQGIDLYDEEAMNIIVSSTTAQHTMVDMATDLKQATSRNRCKTNPNYDSYIYIYNQTDFDRSEEDLLEAMEATKDKVQDQINVVNRCLTGKEQKNVIEGLFASDEFKMYARQDKDVITLNKNGEIPKVKVTFNELSFASDKYFILETRKQYQKGFEVVSRLGGTFSKSDLTIAAPSYKACCKWFKDNVQEDGSIEWQTTAMANSDHADFLIEYYTTFGTTNNNISEAKKLLKAYKKSDVSFVTTKIKGLFSTGKHYTVKEIKAALNAMYKEVGLDRKAKWQDLQEAGMSIKDVTIKGSRYKLIVKK